MENPLALWYQLALQINIFVQLGSAPIRDHSTHHITSSP